MIRDYRNHMRLIGRKSVAKKKLRTERTHGSVEIVFDLRDRKAKLHVYGEQK